MPREKYIREQAPRVFRCAFMVGDRQCAAAGTASHVLSSRPGYNPAEVSWFCTTHITNKDSGPKGLALMDVVDEEWHAKRADPRSESQKAIEKWLSEHPELQKQPTDDQWSHMYRCTAAMPAWYGQRQLLEAIVERSEREYIAREEAMDDRHGDSMDPPDDGLEPFVPSN